MADYLTAPCSECGRSMRVKKDGTIGHHKGRRLGAYYGGREYRCAGAGKPPAVAQSDPEGQTHG